MPWTCDSASLRRWGSITTKTQTKTKTHTRKTTKQNKTKKQKPPSAQERVSPNCRGLVLLTLQHLAYLRRPVVQAQSSAQKTAQRRHVWSADPAWCVFVFCWSAFFLKTSHLLCFRFLRCWVCLFVDLLCFRVCGFRMWVGAPRFFVFLVLLPPYRECKRRRGALRAYTSYLYEKWKSKGPAGLSSSWL